MSEVLDYLAAKHGMADTLRVLLHDDEQLRSRTREEFVSAIEELRSTGAAQGVIRNDVTASDILIALAGVTPPPAPPISASRPSVSSTCWWTASRVRIVDPAHPLQASGQPIDRGCAYRVAVVGEQLEV